MAKKEKQEPEQIKTKQESAQPKNTKQTENVRLPVFLEIVFDLANLIMIFIPVMVAAVSYISGANWLNIVLRTAVTIIVTGILCSGIVRKIVQESINVTNKMLENASHTGTTVDQKG